MTAATFDHRTQKSADGRRDLLVGSIVVCVAVAWFFWDALLLRGAFFVQDVMVQNVPFRHHLHAALAQGHLPVWVPQINAGFPLLAEGQVGALYPPNLALALLLSPWQAVNWSVVLHLMLAAASMVALLGRWQVGLAGRITGGLTYGLSGYLVVRAMSPNYLAVAAWLPLLFCFVDASLMEGRRRWLVWAALVVALQLLAGHPQATAYGMAAVLLFTALRTRRGRFISRMARVGLGVAGGGLWLAAGQILPTLELTTRSARAEGLTYERFVQMSMAPERLITLLLPSVLGNSATGTYWGETADFFIQMCPYLGVLALPMIALALTERAQPGGLSGEEAYAKGTLKLREEDRAFIRDLYDGELIRLDKALSMLVSSWSSGGRKAGIVAVTSDHGEYLGEHGQIGHGFSVFGEVTRVPMVIAAPGRLPAGLQVSTPVQLSDLYSTLLDLSGVAPGAVGSLRGVVSGEPREGPIQSAAWPMAEWARNVGGRFTLGHRLYREGRHALVVDTEGRGELYDLAEDPGMLQDRAAKDPERLVKMLAAARGAFPETATAGRVQVPDEALRQLKALGYVE